MPVLYSYPFSAEIISYAPVVAPLRIHESLNTALHIGKSVNVIRDLPPPLTRVARTPSQIKRPTSTAHAPRACHSVRWILQIPIPTPGRWSTPVSVVTVAPATANPPSRTTEQYTRNRQMIQNARIYMDQMEAQNEAGFQAFTFTEQELQRRIREGREAE